MSIFKGGNWSIQYAPFAKKFKSNFGYSWIPYSHKAALRIGTLDNMCIRKETASIFLWVLVLYPSCAVYEIQGTTIWNRLLNQAQKCCFEQLERVKRWRKTWVKNNILSLWSWWWWEQVEPKQGNEFKSRWSFCTLGFYSGRKARYFVLGFHCDWNDILCVCATDDSNATEVRIFTQSVWSLTVYIAEPE